MVRRAACRDDDLGRRPRRRADGRPGRLDRPGGRAPDPGPARHRRRRPRDRPRRDRAARRRLRVERGERPHQRLVRPPRPAGHPHPARAGRGEVDDLPDHEAGRLGRAQRRRPARRGGRAPGPRQGGVLLARRAAVARSSRGTRRAAGAAYLVRDGVLVEADGRAARPRSPIVGPSIPITIGGLARHNVANALAAAGGARGLGATLDQVRDGLIDFRPTADARRAGSTCSALGAGSSSSTSPTTRPGSGRARRGRGDRRRRRGPGRADHGDHRDRRRPAGRHAARHRPDRRRAGPAGRDQADAALPARPDAPNRSSAS